MYVGEICQENRGVISVFEFGEVEGEGAEEAVPGAREALCGLLLQVHGVAEDGDVGAHETVEDFVVGAYLGGGRVAVGVVSGTGEAERGGWTGGGEEGGGFGGGGSETAEGAGEAEERRHGGV